jgi:hypothetical protein
VDPERFQGTVYKAANWLYVGETKGFRRIRHGYTATASSPKMVAIADWAKSLGKNARQRFGCRFDKGRYIVPSESIIRNVLIRVDPVQLDRALQRWNETYAQEDESLAIDGKTMCNAIDDQGYQTHILSVVGHQSKTCYTQKKSVPCL